MKFQTKKNFLAPLNLSSIINGYNFSYTEDYGLNKINISLSYTTANKKKKLCEQSKKHRNNRDFFLYFSILPRLFSSHRREKHAL